MAACLPSWLSHVEAFVNPDSPSAVQDAGCSELVNSLIQGSLSLSQIVKEMGDYLTVEDDAVRARGILLLGEIWIQLVEQPLEPKIIHTFAEFFSARLKDWRALHGALLGCLALLKRSGNVGSLESDDVKLLAEAVLDNLAVQDYAQGDRMLCMELFERFLLDHPKTIVSIGASFEEGVCMAIEGEKDPRCLLIAFHIVELTMELFPASGKVAEKMFEIISCYFPISFNPAPDDKRGITREDLSMALMKCFASSRVFADFCIPLLLEKLSSALKSAKIDSLKFLGYCSLHYGAESVQKYSTAIWTALKQELLPPSTIDAKDRDEQVLAEALLCFRACIKTSVEGNEDEIELIEKNTFFQMFAQDSFLNDFILCLPGYLVSTNKDDIEGKLNGGLSTEKSISAERVKNTINQTVPVLAAAVRASCFSCFGLLKNLFKCMFEVMKLSVPFQMLDILALLKKDVLDQRLFFSEQIMISILEVLTTILSAAREVAVESLTTVSDIRWVSPVQEYSAEILMVFSISIIAGLQNDFSPSVERIWSIGVSGLEIMASFPPQIPAISDDQYTFVLSFLTSIILEKSQVKRLWEKAVESVSYIGSVVETSTDDGPRLEVIKSLVHLLLEQLSAAEKTLPVEYNLKALAKIVGNTSGSSNAVLRRIALLICDKLNKPLEDLLSTASLLRGLSQHILPCFKDSTVDNEAVVELAIGIWGPGDHKPAPDNHHLIEVAMPAFRISISKCNELSQTVFLGKTLDQFIKSKDPWTMGLFASLIVALRPTIQIPQEDKILSKLLEVVVTQTSSSISFVASEAVGCMLNKRHTAAKDSTNGLVRSSEHAIDSILGGKWLLNETMVPANTEDLSTEPSMRVALHVKLSCVKLLGCVGKGLAMKGDVRVTDIAVLLLKLVVGRRISLDTEDDAVLRFLWPKNDELHAIGNAAAEALGYILKTSMTSLDKVNYCIIKPLYHQRFFTSMLEPIIVILKQAHDDERIRLYYAFGKMVSNIPTVVFVTESVRVLPLLLESLSSLCHEKMYSDVLHSLLLVLSTLLVDKNVLDLSSQHVPAIVNRLLTLIFYEYSMMVRETSLLCLSAVAALPHSQVFPLRNQVLKSLMNALDDKKRAVRREAVRCRRVWDAIGH